LLLRAERGKTDLLCRIEEKNGGKRRKRGREGSNGKMNVLLA